MQLKILLMSGRYETVHLESQDETTIMSRESPESRCWTALSIILVAERERTHADLRLGDNHDCASLDLIRMVIEDLLKIMIDGVGTHIAESKEKDAWQFGTGCSEEFPKVEIMGHQNPTFVPCFRQYCVIIEPRESFVIQMACVGAPAAEKTHHIWRDSHIQEKSHAYADLAG